MRSFITSTHRDILLLGLSSKDEVHRACTKHVTDENEYTILVGKPEKKRPFGRYRCI